ncbi:MAG: YfhO family protein [Alphaproteobacteria bacterium]
MPLMIVAAESFPNLPGWVRYVASGAPLLAQGVPVGPLTSILGIIPVWPGYIIVFLLQAAAGGTGIYLFCRDYLGIQKSVGTLVVLLVIVLSSSVLLMATPVLLAPFFSWLVLRFAQDRPVIQKAVAAALGGLALGIFSSSFLAISFWVLVGPAIIFIGSKKLSESILLAAVFLVSSLVPIADEIVSLAVNLSESHRFHTDAYENFTVFEFALRYLSSPFLTAGLLLIFVKNKTKYIKKAVTLYLFLTISILIILFASDRIAEHNNFADLLKGFNYMRLLNPHMFLGLVCAGVFVSSFETSKNKYLSPLLIIGFLIVPLADKYTRYTLNSARSWVVAGNSERFIIPQIKAIAKDAQSSTAPYRVDMVNFPLGSGFLAAYKLESAGGYLTMYPNRYQNFFADAVMPEVSGLSAPSRDSVLSWGNRLNFTCDFIYDGVLAMDECMDMDLVALLNIRYLISRNPMHHENLRLVDGADMPWNLRTTRQKIRKSVEENFGAREALFIFELKRYAPRAFVVDQIQVASDQIELSDLLRAASLESLLIKAMILSEDLVTLPHQLRETLEYATDSTQLDTKVTDLQFSGDLFKINVESNKPGVLIVTNSLAVGWHATVNGEAVEILPAYGAFWGIPVIAGNNDVQLEYESYTSTTDLLRWIKARITSN